MKVETEDGKVKGEIHPLTEADISRVMSELGKRGGKVGGKARAATLTPTRRTEIAVKAARARWGLRVATKPTEPLFPKGSRVRYSARGLACLRIKGRYAGRIGTAGTTTSGDGWICCNVTWDGRKSAEGIALSFLEIAPPV